jgi:hypothetical protein
LKSKLCPYKANPKNQKTLDYVSSVTKQNKTFDYVSQYKIGGKHSPNVSPAIHWTPKEPPQTQPALLLPSV